MAIERAPVDVVVVSVIMSNGLTVEHRYPIGHVRNQQEFERMMGPILREPIEALMGVSPAKAFTLANPVGVYNITHVMTLRVRAEGSSQAMQMVDLVHEMGFLARDRS